jgi:hypothetical protein
MDPQKSCPFCGLQQPTKSSKKQTPCTLDAMVNQFVGCLLLGKQKQNPFPDPPAGDSERRRQPPNTTPPFSLYYIYSNGDGSASPHPHMRRCFHENNKNITLYSLGRRRGSRHRAMYSQPPTTPQTHTSMHCSSAYATRQNKELSVSQSKEKNLPLSTRFIRRVSAPKSYTAIMGRKRAGETNNFVCASSSPAQGGWPLSFVRFLNS